MDKKMHDKGLEIRKAVLGEAYVSNALKSVDDFNRPFQEMLNEYCWGTVWGREELPRKTRSMLNIAMIAILNRQHQIAVHQRKTLLRGAVFHLAHFLLGQKGDQRGWIRWLGLIAVAGVSFQGVLGGLRVIADERLLAKIHGCTAPLFFALTASLVTFTSGAWKASLPGLGRAAGGDFSEDHR